MPCIFGITKTESPLSATTEVKSEPTLYNNHPAGFLCASLCAVLLLATITAAQTNVGGEGSREGSKDGSGNVEDVVVSTAFSPDGRTLAIARGARESAGRRVRIELWDTVSGELRHSITGFDGPVWSVSYSPDGKTLVSSSTESHDTRVQARRSRAATFFTELKWWDALTGEFKRKLTIPGDYHVSLVVDYSPDGKSLVASEHSRQMAMTLPHIPDFDRTQNIGGSIRANWAFTEETDLIKILDAETGEVRVKVKGGLTYPRFSIDEGMLPQWLFGGRRLERPLLSADGQLLAAYSPREVKLWNASSGAEVRTLKKFKGRPSAIAFSPDSRILAVSNTRLVRISDSAAIPESQVQLVEISTGKVLRTLDGKRDLIKALAFTPNGRALLIGTLQYQSEQAVGTLKMWDLQTERLLSIDTNEGQPVESLMFPPKGRVLALQSGESSIELWDTVTWKAKYSFYSETDDATKAKSYSGRLVSVKLVLGVAFSPDGKTLSGEVPDDGIKLWDPRTGEVKQRIPLNKDAASVIAISPDGKTLAEVNNKAVSIWDLQHETNSTRPLPNTESISTIALSSGGQILAIAHDREVMLWDTGRGETTHTLTGHGSNINGLIFSRDGRTLVSADESGAIRTWDPATAQSKVTITSGGKVTALSLAASGQALASAGADYSVSVWDLQTGALQQRLKKHHDLVNALAFSPDGKLLASGGDDRSVIIWDSISGKSIRILKGHDLSVTSLSFSPAGDLVASGSGNASVILWNVQTGKVDRILR